MNTNTKQYDAMKKDFFSNHDCDFATYTSPFENGGYHKEYCFEDGATWYENTRRQSLPCNVNPFDTELNITCYIDFMVTEYWNTDDSSSYFLLEKY